MGDCTLIADPNGKAWPFAFAIYQQLKQRTDRFELHKIIVNEFRDGEIKPKIEKNIRKKQCFFIHDSSLPPAKWFLELCLINQALTISSATEVIDVLPYLLFSRQDRKDESRVPISARVVADAAEQYADRVLTLEVHNLSIQGFYDIVFDNLFSFPTVVTYLKKYYPSFLKNLVIMSPDAGGANRARGLAKQLDITDIAIGYKVREKAGEVSTLKILGDVLGKNVLMVDDIIDSGNTLVKACAAVRAQGAKAVCAYATHGLFTEGTKKLTNCFNKVFIGDTVFNEKDSEVEVISFAPLFAEAIYRISEGQSLSQLFE